MCSDLRFTNVVAAFISELITKKKKSQEEGEEGSAEEGELQEDAGD